jgi:hypothetical protein
LTGAAKKRRGRAQPGLARAERRVVARLYPEDELALTELCAQLGLGPADVVRRALREFAKRKRVR